MTNELTDGVEAPTVLSPSSWTGTGGRRRGSKSRKSLGKKSKSLRKTKRSTGKKGKKPKSKSNSRRR